MRRRRGWAGWFGVLFLIMPSGLVAEELEEGEALDPVVVTATRLEEPLQEVASSVTVITAEEVKRRQQASIAEAIRSVPGLDVIQAGGPGRAAEVLIRGAGSGQTLVMMDGIELNDPISVNRSYDFSYLTTDNIERIEVVRGPQSILYGSDASGGVINIITKKGEGPFKASLTGEAGTYQTYSTQAEASGSLPSFHYSLGASYLNSEGISAAAEKGVTPSGERYRNPETDEYRNSAISGKVGWAPIPQLDGELVLRYMDSRSALDNYGGKGGDDPNSYQEGQQFYGRAQGRLSLFNGIWEQKLGASVSNQDRDYQNDSDPDHPYEEEAASYDGRMVKFDWQHNLYLHPTNTATLGLEYEMEKGRSDYRSEFFGYPFESTLEEEKATTKSAYLQDEVRLKDALFVTAGIRLDDHDRFGSQTSWRLAPALLIRATGTRIKGSYGTGFKAPTLYQLFSQYGNADLDPERSRGWDVGVEQEFWEKAMSVGITYFDNRFEDLIDFDTGLNRYVNQDEVKTRGVEVSLLLKPIRDLSVQATYTRTDAEDQKTGLTLVRRPRNKFGIEANYRFGERANFHLAYRYIGKRWDYDFSTFPSTRVELSKYVLVNLAASFDVNPHLRLFGRIDNLLDEDYQEIQGYGTPGRSVFGGIEVSF